MLQVVPASLRAAEEIYGEGVEALVQEEDAQPLEVGWQQQCPAWGHLFILVLLSLSRANTNNPSRPIATAKQTHPRQHKDGSIEPNKFSRSHFYLL